MKIPFNDLSKQHSDIEVPLSSLLDNVCKHGQFIQGPEVFEFERAFALASRAKYCISCANGTDALFIAIKSLGVCAGDEVLVPAISWIATSEVVSLAGGKPIFVDVDPKTYTIDLNKLESRISSKTIGIIPVHLYGQPCDMLGINEVAKRHNLWIVEDCAQSHFASQASVPIGAYSQYASYSFYPGKNLGAIGDAGALTTNDSVLAEKATKFARHGGLKKGIHEIEGLNSRLDTFQAAVLLEKLKRVEAWTQRRIDLANCYTSKLTNIELVVTPFVPSTNRHVYHLYVIQAPNRDSLKHFLSTKGIQTAINYPLPLPLLPAYSHLGLHSQDYPIASALTRSILSLPLHPFMHISEVDYVVDCIKDFYDD